MLRCCFFRFYRTVPQHLPTGASRVFSLNNVGTINFCEFWEIDQRLLKWSLHHAIRQCSVARLVVVNKNALKYKKNWWEDSNEKDNLVIIYEYLPSHMEKKVTIRLRQSIVGKRKSTDNLRPAIDLALEFLNQWRVHTRLTDEPPRVQKTIPPFFFSYPQFDQPSAALSSYPIESGSRLYMRPGYTWKRL